MGYSALFKMVKCAKERRRPIKFCNMHEDVRVGAEAVSMPLVVEIHENAAAALAAFAQGLNRRSGSPATTRDRPPGFPRRGRDDVAGRQADGEDRGRADQGEPRQGQPGAELGVEHGGDPREHPGQRRRLPDAAGQDPQQEQPEQDARDEAGDRQGVVDDVVLQQSGAEGHGRQDARPRPPSSPARPASGAARRPGR